MNQSNVVQKLWNYCNVLRDDGMSYGDYVEQLTYLLFLKMADERTKAPYNQKSPVPKEYSWPVLVKKDGDELFDHYRHTLEVLGNQKGLLGLIFNKSQNKFQDPAKLRRLVVDLIDKEEWVSMSADVKGDAYEGLLEKNAQDTKSGAGQYFTPRPLIQAIVDVMAPKPGETVSDPACGTGGFLLAAHDYVVKHNPNLTKPQKTKLKEETFKGWELVQATARLCAMNMLLHGIGSQDFEPIAVSDSLAADPGDRFDLVLTNPPFGKKSSTTIVGEEGKVSRERDIVERGDFWTTTSNAASHGRREAPRRVVRGRRRAGGRSSQPLAPSRPLWASVRRAPEARAARPQGGRGAPSPEGRRRKECAVTEGAKGDRMARSAY